MHRTYHTVLCNVHRRPFVPEHAYLNRRGFAIENSLNAANALTRLEEPFASKDVKWLVAATSRDGRKGRVTPYADPRAYTDRLNEILIARGWDEGILGSPCLSDHIDEEGQARSGGKGAGVLCCFYPRGVEHKDTHLFLTKAACGVNLCGSQGRYRNSGGSSNQKHTNRKRQS